MKHYSGKDKKNLNGNFPIGYSVTKKDELVNVGGVLFRNREYFLIELQSKEDLKKYRYIPHLKSSGVKSLDCAFKKIIIDVGAVPFLLKGADMMRPGITHIDEGIEKGECVIICDEVKQLIIGVGFSLYSFEELQEMKVGRVIEVVHYFKDAYYEVVL